MQAAKDFLADVLVIAMVGLPIFGAIMAWLARNEPKGEDW